MLFFNRRVLQLVIACVLWPAISAVAQTPSTPPASPPPTPAEAPSEPPSPAPAQPKGQRPQRVEAVEITGKNSATDERRNSSAAKIIITREDLEQYGDSNLGEAMRRLPGVSTGGRPGRPGAPTMRGMGGGFTQILLDGQRLPPGFSLEQITPDQVDRIEILRAPTAETGARAIAGTINIILREPLRQTNDEFKLGVQEERNKYSPNVSWTHNATIGEAGTYNLTASTTFTHQLSDDASHTIYEDLLSGAKLLEQYSFGRVNSERENYFLSARGQWRLGNGEQFGVQAFLAHNTSDSHSAGTLDQTFGLTPSPYATRAGSFLGRFDVARINVNLNKRFDAETRYEIRGGIGRFWSNTDSVSEQFASNGARNLLQTSRGDVRDRSWNMNGKVVRNFANAAHSVSAGWELDNQVRNETSLTRLNGAQQLAELGSEFDVATQRIALYLQDEWDINREWGANAGIRYESIKTSSSNAQDRFTNTSRVLTPLAHLVWRFAAPSRDQLRLSLTQSYRSPNTGQLSTRPTLNTLYPVPGANTAISPDRTGNPNLKPERANGIDLAFERYLTSGGVVSVNLFVRDIKDLIRNVTALENVSWAPADRYVSRPQNIGKAITKGIEFDAKFQLKELIADAIPLNLRFNLSVYDSKVAAIMGPYNHIDQQPRASGNLGADYKFRSLPISVGGNIAWTPAYTTQQSDTQLQKISTKRVYDAYALWTVNALAKLRLSVSNISPIEGLTTGITRADGQRQTTVSTGRTDMSVALRLEMRL